MRGAWLGCLLWLAGASAHAQDAPDAGVAPSAGAQSDYARALFEQGVELAEQERWGEAVELFRRSRAIVDRPSTAFNVAVALVRLGRHTEAITALEEYAAMADPEEGERRAEAEELLAMARASVAELTLAVDPPGAEVRVDGVAADPDDATGVLSLDPGRHTVSVVADGYLGQTFEVSLLSGEHARRAITLAPVARETTPPDGPSIFAEPWLWIAAGVIVAGAAVGIGIALSSGTEDPYPGTTGVVLEALH